MPINTVQVFIRDRLNGLILPRGLGTLDAYIVPPNPRDDASPGAYVWGSHGEESRLTVPRAQFGNLATGGDKTLRHRVDVWLTWFGPSEDPMLDLQFPSIIDAVMGVLRNTPLVDAAANTQHVTDPVTGQLSQLLNLGEDQSWDYGPVRATADQRMLRFDANINTSVDEIIQS